MNRGDRLYALAEELRRAGPGGRTAQRLADRFEISTRTVKRDVAALQDAGVPVSASAGPGGGYALDPVATLPPVTFTPGQAVAIAVALTARAGGPYADDGEAALAKLVDVMGPAAREQARALAGRIWVRGARPRRSAALREVEQALADRRVVALEYADAQGRITRRRVEPHLLAYTRGAWYLIGWCRDRDAVRWFRWDRVRQAHATAEPVPARDPVLFGEPPADAAPVAVDGPVPGTTIGSPRSPTTPAGIRAGAGSRAPTAPRTAGRARGRNR